MRIPDNLLYRLHAQNINASRTQVADAQMRAATGMRVTKPSDDPLASSQAREFTNRIEQALSSLRAIEGGTGRLQLSESVLSEATNLISRAQELTVQLSNSTWNADDREATALEVRSIREQMRTLANTEHNGEYIFAGFDTDTPPYDGTFAFVSDANVREIEVSPGMRIETHINGGTAFGGPAGTTDVMAVLDRVATALETDDQDALRNTLTELESAHEQVIQGRARVGTLLNRLEVSREIAIQTHDRALEDRSNAVEADPIEAAQDLIRADGALQAAISIASRLPLPGLLGRR